LPLPGYIHANSTAIADVAKGNAAIAAGFISKTVTTTKQQQRVSQLPPNVVSAVKYQGKLYYVYPTAKKDQILVGKQAQYDAYKQALKAKRRANKHSRRSNGKRCWRAAQSGLEKRRDQITSQSRSSMDSVH